MDKTLTISRLNNQHITNYLINATSKDTIIDIGTVHTQTFLNTYVSDVHQNMK